MSLVMLVIYLLVIIFLRFALLRRLFYKDTKLWYEFLCINQKTDNDVDDNGLALNIFDEILINTPSVVDSKEGHYPLAVMELAIAMERCVSENSSKQCCIAQCGSSKCISSKCCCGFLDAFYNRVYNHAMAIVNGAAKTVVEKSNYDHYRARTLELTEKQCKEKMIKCYSIQKLFSESRELKRFILGYTAIFKAINERTSIRNEYHKSCHGNICLHGLNGEMTITKNYSQHDFLINSVNECIDRDIDDSTKYKNLLDELSRILWCYVCIKDAGGRRYIYNKLRIKSQNKFILCILDVIDEKCSVPDAPPSVPHTRAQIEIAHSSLQPSTIKP
ncbi:MAG: hypothetical protein FWD05_04730 [Oscillospiraceae bacterium]|nr:hypothetical protein [Oscillospiraceae bacterium]